MLLQKEMMRWQWHQQDHMQIICISLQTDNHASTLPILSIKTKKLNRSMLLIYCVYELILQCAQRLNNANI